MKPLHPRPEVHRLLERHDEGDDVVQLRAAVNRRARSFKLPFLEVATTGKVDPRLENSVNLLLFAQGVYGPAITRVRTHHEISEYAQKILRGTRHRTPPMVALSTTRRKTVRKWRREHDHPVPVQEKEALADLVGLIAKGMAYLWGGGHVTPANSGPGDCSWLASRTIQHFDPSIPTGTTYTLAEAGVEGQGVRLTLKIKNIDGEPDESHVIEEWAIPAELVKKYHLGQYVVGHDADGLSLVYSECGGSDNPTPGNGPTFFIPGQGMGLTVAQRVAEFNSAHRHAKGF